MKKRVAAGMILMSLLSLCGCSAGQAETYALVLSCDTSYMEKVAEGFTAEVEAAGAKAVIRTPEGMSISEQYQILTDLQKTGVDALAIIPNSSSAYNTIVEEYSEADIPVAALGSSINSDYLALEIFACDYVKVAGELLARAAEYLGGEGQIAILSTSNQDYAAEEIMGAVRELLEAGEYPEILLTEIAYSYNEEERCKKKIEHLYETYPDLELVLTLTAESTRAAAAYIEEAGLSDELCVAGYGLEEEVDEYLGSSVAFYYTYDPEKLGRLAAQILIKTDQEDLKYAQGDEIDLGALGSYEVFSYQGIYAQEDSASYPMILMEEAVTWVETE